MQAATVKERKTDVQLTQGKTILVRNMGEGHVGNIEETKERGLDRPADGDIATGAIWWRSVEAPKRGG